MTATTSSYLALPMYLATYLVHSSLTITNLACVYLLIRVVHSVVNTTTENLLLAQYYMPLLAYLKSWQWLVSCQTQASNIWYGQGTSVRTTRILP